VEEVTDFTVLQERILHHHLQEVQLHHYLQEISCTTTCRSCCSFVTTCRRYYTAYSVNSYQVHYIFSQSLELSGHLHTLTYSFAAIDYLLLLHCTSVRPKLRYTSPVCNNISTTDAKKLKNIQHQSAAPCFCHLFSVIPYNHT